MIKHQIPAYIQGIPGLEKVKLIAPTGSKPVPPESGVDYRKNPRRESDLSARIPDRYFFACLYGIYGEGCFERGDLDAGRLNRLWCLDVLCVADEVGHDRESKDARFFLNAKQAFIEFRGAE